MDKEKLLDIGLQKRKGLLTESWQQLAEQYGGEFFNTGELFRSWVKYQVYRKGVDSDKVIKPLKDEKTQTEKPTNFKETHEIHQDGSQSSSKLIRLSLEQNKNPKYILEAHGFDPSEWEIVNVKNSEWTGYSKQDGQFPQYSSKITVKVRKDELDIQTIKEIFNEINRDYKSPVHIPTRYSSNGKMLELSIADLHLGKLCWAGDSNDTYNFQIARQRFFHIINDVLTKTNNQKFEKILFVWSNDFFHFDNLNQSTTKGTHQDTNMKLTQMFKFGMQMLIEAIDILKGISPVETFYIGSNHDKLMSYYATETLAAWFRNDPNVMIDTDPKIRKYVEFGKCLIQFSHGHAEGKRIGDVMSVEERESWGRCLYTEVHAGHYHSERTITKDNGVIVRYLGSPTGVDTWHYESGYVSAIKRGQSFIWDRENGLEQAIYTTIK